MQTIEGHHPQGTMRDRRVTDHRHRRLLAAMAGQGLTIPRTDDRILRRGPGLARLVEVGAGVEAGVGIAGVTHRFRDRDRGHRRRLGVGVRGVMGTEEALEGKALGGVEAAGGGEARATAVTAVIATVRGV